MGLYLEKKQYFLQIMIVTTKEEYRLIKNELNLPINQCIHRFSIFGWIDVVYLNNINQTQSTSDLI